MTVGWVDPPATVARSRETRNLSARTAIYGSCPVYQSAPSVVQIEVDLRRGVRAIDQDRHAGIVARGDDARHRHDQRAAPT